MSPQEFTDAFAVYVERGSDACFGYVTDTQGFTKVFARKVCAFFESTVVVA